MAVTLASVDGTWTNAGTYDAAELRRADAALFASAGITSGLAVSVDGSDVVTVTAGSAVISGEDAVTGTGVYRAGIGSSVTGSLEARDATNARIDLVVFRQYDTAVVGSHGKYASDIEIIKGTPSATPAVPTKPSMAVELARITVPASGGGAASVNSANRVAALAVGAPKIATGTATVSLAASTSGSQSITFPAGRFSTQPKVVATSNSSSLFTVQAAATSTTTGTIILRHYEGSSITANVTVDWIAIGS